MAYGIVVNNQFLYIQPIFGNIQLEIQPIFVYDL